MLRLCSDSSRPYPGRSAQLASDLPACGNDQSGNWYIKPGRIDMLSVGTSEGGSSDQSRGTAHLGVIPGVTEQKSAEAIVAQRPG